MKLRSRDGVWTVEVIRLTLTPDHHDGEWLRVRFHGFFMGDVATVAELAEYVSLADLEEIDLPDVESRRRSAAPDNLHQRLTTQ